MLTHDCVDTVCYYGHVYCQECSPNCPTCNKAYVPRDFQGLKELEGERMTTEYQITRDIGRIVEILEEFHGNYDDMDVLKTAIEIRSIARGEDGEIADNMKSYWANQNAGSVDWRG